MENDLDKMNNRKLINNVLEKYGIPREVYESILVQILRNQVVPEDAAKKDSMRFYLGKEFAYLIESKNLSNGTVEYDASDSLFGLIITESGEFLEKIKRRAYGTCHLRYKVA